MEIGEIISKNDCIELSIGKAVTEVEVTNTGDRPIQIGSHFHFFEVNRLLVFDRKIAYGYHLDIPSGTSVRFEPGETKTVRLVEMGGRKRVFGLNDLTCMQTGEHTLEKAMENARVKGMLEKEEEEL